MRYFGKLKRNWGTIIPERIQFTPASKKDLRQIAHYTLARYGKVQAESYVDKLYYAIDQLRHHPQSGSPQGDICPGYRALICEEHKIFYRHRSGIVEIVRILHQHMNYPCHLP